MRMMNVSSARDGDEHMSWDDANAAAADQLGPGTKKRGVKRHADDSDLNDEQRFTKRFNLLNIDSQAKANTNSNYYIPISPKSQGQNATASNAQDGVYHEEENMQVDETKDRVFIHSLDDELADIETQEAEPKLIFLPDIEKRFSRIPHHVLTGGAGGRGNGSGSGQDGIGEEPDDHYNQELVLYNIPKSLTIDEGHDSVRKAIIESRQRARAKATEEARHQDMSRKYDTVPEHDSAVETAHGYGAGYDVESDGGRECDADAMDTG